jgi:hypothetical protein
MCNARWESLIVKYTTLLDEHLMTEIRCLHRVATWISLIQRWARILSNGML